jgi:hypothetical protein
VIQPACFFHAMFSFAVHQDAGVIVSCHRIVAHRDGLMDVWEFPL